MEIIFMNRKFIKILFRPALHQLFSKKSLTSIDKMTEIVGVWEKNKYTIRQARIEDIPRIAFLINYSYMAIADPVTDKDQRARADVKLKENADSLIKSELLESASFLKTYFGDGFRNLWVYSVEGGEEAENAGIYGCIGIKSHQDRQGAEMIRMSVLPNFRGLNIGSILVHHCIDYCKNHGIERIYLTTANMRAASFYKKLGFHTYSHYKSTFIEPDIIWDVVRQISYLERGPIVDKVAIVGGTHGNERTGVELVRGWASDGFNTEGHCKVRDGSEISRKSFETHLIEANPRAIEANKRFIDVDLNRQLADFGPSSEPIADEAYEVTRARTLTQILGPKVPAINEMPVRVRAKNGFIIDLHSSNSNVGIMAMICAVDTDVLAVRLAHFLKTEVYPDLKITSKGNKKSETWSVDSISACGIAFEVGPLVHGTVDAGLLAITKELIARSLDFIDRSNTLEYTIPPQVIGGQFPILEYYLFVSIIKFPEEEGYRLVPSFENKDWSELRMGDTIFIKEGGADIKLHIDSSVTRQVFPKYREINAGTDDAFYPVFIKEAAYASSSIAFCVYRKVKMFVV